MASSRPSNTSLNQWADIPNRHGYYISSSGDVLGPKGLRKLVPDRVGYLTVVLKRPLKCYKVHRLVAEAFCVKPESSETLEVHHLNENKSDNRASNLQWVTRQQNQAASLAREFVLNAPTGETHTSYNLKWFCRVYGLDPGNMSKVLNGKQKSYRGWTSGKESSQ